MTLPTVTTSQLGAAWQYRCDQHEYVEPVKVVKSAVETLLLCPKCLETAPIDAATASPGHTPCTIVISPNYKGEYFKRNGKEIYRCQEPGFRDELCGAERETFQDLKRHMDYFHTTHPHTTTTGSTNIETCGEAACFHRSVDSCLQCGGRFCNTHLAMSGDTTICTECCNDILSSRPCVR